MSVDYRNWIALMHVSGLGPVGWRKLADSLGEPDAILGASSHLLAKSGVSKKVADAIVSFSDWDRVDKDLESLDRLGARVVLLSSPEYPDGLKRIHDAPMVLFVLGEILPEDDLSIAMVGTRRPGGYGKRIAEPFHQLCDTCRKRGPVDAVTHRLGGFQAHYRLDHAKPCDERHAAHPREEIERGTEGPDQASDG